MRMNQEAARDYAVHNAGLILKPAKDRKSMLCPICGSGGGDNGTGITTIDGVHYSCWRGCFKHSDIIDIYGLKYGITDYRAKLEGVCSEMGISVEWGASPYRQAAGKEGIKGMGDNQQGAGQYTHPDIHTTAYTQKQEAPEEDFTEYYARCHAHLMETDYHRGLSQVTLDRFNVGYDKAWRHPKVVREGKNPPATPRLIIPTSAVSYLARDTRADADVPEQQKKYRKSKVGKVHIFNLAVLDDTGKPCFIQEGEIDAMSICEVGANALALGSTSNVDIFLKALEGRKNVPPFIVDLDNDKAGAEAADKLCNGLAERGIPFYRGNPFGGYKDANEALVNDREGFTSAVMAAVESVTGIAAEEEEKARAEYAKSSNYAYLQNFLDGVADSVNTSCISTGFPTLDKLLDGGFYEGLYIMGAISSLGKTTFALQICDQIAAAGTDVLIFSLEMARTELMSKSISRHSFTIAHEKWSSPKEIEKANRMAKTGRGVTDGKRYINYSHEERELISAAVDAYSEYAGHIFISEGVGNIGAEEIRSSIEKHIRLTGRRPVVLLDYLQLLSPANDRATDKQNTDKAVLELKRISRDFKITIFAISSLNRVSYKGEVNMESFKESGAIEYSSDCLLGLQLKGAGKEDFDSTAEKSKDPRIIELKVLKNRNGPVGGKAVFSYYSLFNIFEEA